MAADAGFYSQANEKQLEEMGVKECLRPQPEYTASSGDHARNNDRSKKVSAGAQVARAESAFSSGGTD